MRNRRRDSLVIIPTYNEADNIARLVPRVLDQGPFDVLIVDDHSPDGTGHLADSLAQSFPGRVTVLHRSGKLGLASAYIQGFGHALVMGYEHVFEMDADGSHDPAYLPALRHALDAADVVLGSRYVAGGGTGPRPLWRHVLSRGGSIYAAGLLGLSIRDVTGGFKGFRRRVLESLNLDGIQSNGYAFQVEVTHRCHQHGFRIVEVPITFEERRNGHSKMNWQIIVEALLVVWRLRLSPPVRREVHPWLGS